MRITAPTTARINVRVVTQIIVGAISSPGTAHNNKFCKGVASGCWGAAEASTALKASLSSVALPAVRSCALQMAGVQGFSAQATPLRATCASMR